MTKQDYTNNIIVTIQEINELQKEYISLCIEENEISNSDVQHTRLIPLESDCKKSVNYEMFKVFYDLREKEEKQIIRLSKSDLLLYSSFLTRLLDKCKENVNIKKFEINSYKNNVLSEEYIEVKQLKDEVRKNVEIYDTLIQENIRHLNSCKTDEQKQVPIFELVTLIKYIKSSQQRYIKKVDSIESYDYKIINMLNDISELTMFYDDMIHYIERFLNKNDITIYRKNV